MKSNYDIIWLDCTDSTNDEARRRICDLDNLSVIAAMSQTKGRGQGDHIWLSETGKNLLFTIILKFSKEEMELRARDQVIISQITSDSVVELLELYGIDSWIKLPNDIYVGEKKICGMLIENTIKGSDMLSSIIGIGLNVNQRNFDVNLPNPVSMSQLTGQEYDIREVLDSFMNIFIQNIERHFRKI